MALLYRRRSHICGVARDTRRLSPLALDDRRAIDHLRRVHVRLGDRALRPLWDDAMLSVGPASRGCPENDHTMYAIRRLGRFTARGKRPPY